MRACTEGIWDEAFTPPTAYNPAINPAYTSGAGAHLNPNVIYISDSPGAITQVLRYTINKDTQDSFSNFGLFADGSQRQYSFGFSPTEAPDGTMYLGDDPSAGANAFNGNIWRIAAGSPADVLGQPGLPASPPAPPAQKIGTLNRSGVTLPRHGVRLRLCPSPPGHTA